MTSKRNPYPLYITFNPPLLLAPSPRQSRIYFLWRAEFWMGTRSLWWRQFGCVGLKMGMDDQVWSWWGMWKNEGGEVMGRQTVIYAEEFALQLVSQSTKMYWDPMDSVLCLQRGFNSTGSHCRFRNPGETCSEWYWRQRILAVLCEPGAR